ncbi:MAG: hypothetical protein K2Q06_11320 [Parvularculaceae bacterium]|nr:hypothetical protein [Parvularculaceae bacterium]
MNAAYIWSHIRGVWGMAWGRAGWEAELDRTIEGVFRSFVAVAIAAAVMAAVFAGARAASDATAAKGDVLLTAPLPTFLLANLSVFVADWATGLAALLFAARLLKAEKRAGDAVIGYNWSQLIVAAAQAAPLGVLAASRSQAAFVAAFFVALIVAVALIWGVVRRGLGLAPSLSMAVVAALLLIGFIVQRTTYAVADALYVWASP